MKNIYRWDNLTRPEIERLRDEGAIVIIPTGSIEQHGPHLPVGADYLISTGYAERVAKILHDRYGKSAVVAPSVAIANSLHPMSFPGTISLQPATYMQWLLEYCQCIAQHGFTKIVMINGHGGNVVPTETAIITINEKLGFPVYMMTYECGSEKEVDEILETQRAGIHACEMETSVALHLYPDLVDPSYKEVKSGNYSKENSFGGGGKPYTFWRIEHYTDNGAIGNTYAASPEKGKRLVEAYSNKLAEIIAGLWE